MTFTKSIDLTRVTDDEVRFAWVITDFSSCLEDQANEF